MKRFGILAAGLCAAFVLTACNSTETQNTSAGAVGSKQCCSDAKACDTTKACAKGEACCKAGDKAAVKGSMGTVGDSKPECQKQCPATATKDASMGAVSGKAKKSGCCSKSAS
jgi:hypothetical protein